jgi:RHS repeat-associated protein
MFGQLIAVAVQSGISDKTLSGHLYCKCTTIPNTSDRLNRLSGVGVAASCAYNGLGDRLSETANGQTTHYTMDLNAGLTQVLQDGTNTYLCGAGRVAQYGANGPEYYLGDALGSVRQMVDASGNVTLGRNYKPYGGVLSSMGGGATSYGFTNEWTDASTGEVYLRARWYAPGQGRFLTKDVWAGDSSNPMSYNAWLYGYANPITFIDPSGYFPLLEFERDPVKRNGGKANFWKYSEMVAAEQAAGQVASALALNINYTNLLRKSILGDNFKDCPGFPMRFLTPLEAFYLVYKGPVTWEKVPEQGPGGAFGKTYGRNRVRVFSNHYADYTVQHPGWVIHELGHAFEYALSPTDSSKSPGRNGLPLNLLIRKLKDPMDPEKDDPIDPNAGFASSFERGYQYSQGLGREEIFADMFLGWVKNKWATNRDIGQLTEMGQARSDHMMQNMSTLIRIAIETP